MNPIIAIYCALSYNLILFDVLLHNAIIIKPCAFCFGASIKYISKGNNIRFIVFVGDSGEIYW